MRLRNGGVMKSKGLRYGLAGAGKYVSSVFLLLGICLVTNTLYADSEKSSYVIFNLPELPAGTQARGKNGTQPMIFFGCNTFVNVDSSGNQKYQTSLNWGQDNQVYTKLPFGKQTDASGNYHISKYYMASPPLGETGDASGNVIGLVIPDRFTFHGDAPAQIVNLDYSVLHPVEIELIPAAYGQSCVNEQVDYIPVNIQCRDFPWKSNDASLNVAAEGATGIGFLRGGHAAAGVNSGSFFLPYLKEARQPLDCQVTILDDVMPYHEVCFAADGAGINSHTAGSSATPCQKTLNLKDYVLNPQNRRQHGQSKFKPIHLACQKRSQLPAGCSQPVNW